MYDLLANNLKAHKEFEHEEIRYPCDQCEYAATRYSDLMTHKISKHEGIPVTYLLTYRYPCDQCGFVANQLSDLKKHIESNHEGIRYPCDQCEYAATHFITCEINLIVVIQNNASR